MSDLVSSHTQKDGFDGGTNIGRFLANRGAILLKEIRPIGVLKCQHGAKISVETIVVTKARSSTKIGAKSHAVRFETTDSNERACIGSLDFDESEEFGNAITYFFEASNRIAGEKRDYTEATFSTKDDIKVGFFQTTDQDQTAFFQAGGMGDSVFRPTTHLPALKKRIDSAREYLIKKCAVVDSIDP